MLIRIAQGAFILAFVVWVIVGASRGTMFLEICEKVSTGERKCDNYDVFSYAAWQIVKSLDVTAIATVFIAIFTLTLWKVNRDQLAHNRKVERAYVKMSHTPPGVKFGESGHFDITVEIKNHGQTPATITDVLLTGYSLKSGERLPIKPPYDRPKDHEPSHAFLVSDDRFFSVMGLSGEESEINQVFKGERQFLILGYVDYIDQFNQRYRAGYARRFQDFPENNLVFVTEPGYNYDRVRRRGEGNDWNKPA